MPRKEGQAGIRRAGISWRSEHGCYSSLPPSPPSPAFYLGPTISAIKHFPDPPSLSRSRSTHRWLLEQRVINESALVKLPRPSFVLRFLPTRRKIVSSRLNRDREAIARNLFSLELRVEIFLGEGKGGIGNSTADNYKMRGNEISLRRRRRRKRYNELTQ